MPTFDSESKKLKFGPMDRAGLISSIKNKLNRYGIKLDVEPNIEEAQDAEPLIIGYHIKAEKVADPKNQPIDSYKLTNALWPAMSKFGLDYRLTQGMSAASIQRRTGGTWIGNSALNAMLQKLWAPKELTEEETRQALLRSENAILGHNNVYQERLAQFVAALAGELGFEKVGAQR